MIISCVKGFCFGNMLAAFYQIMSQQIYLMFLIGANALSLSEDIKEKDDRE